LEVASVSPLIPPTSQKFIRRDSLLHRLWLIARDKLPLCRWIVLIGYSFPATDFYSEWLFRQIYLIEGPHPDIIVVNPEIMKKRSAVTKRYENIFRGCTMHRFSDLEAFHREGASLLCDEEQNEGQQPPAPRRA